MKEYLLEKKVLSTNSLYNYCPLCVRQFKETNHDVGKSYKDVLQPIVYTKVLQVYTDKDNKELKALDEYWLCTRCKIRLTTEDFRYAYCCRSDGTRYNEPPLSERTKNGQVEVTR